MKKIVAILVLLVPAVSAFTQHVALTIYNNNLALVRETREMSIDKGVSTAAFTDVAAQIDPTSVHFNSLTSPGKLQILEQNYEYDLVSSTKMMQKYIDQPIRIVMAKGDVYDGELMSVSGSDVILKTIDGKIQIIKGNGILHVEFPELPDGLITKPTLNWLLRNTGKEIQQTEIDYLTAGIAWHAEYVGVVNQADDAIGLSGWVSINNQSGKTYENAALKLIAGEINRVQRKQPDRRLAKGMVYAAEAAPPQFEEKSFFEYHMYTLQRPATVAENQIKQVSLFPSSNSACEKIFSYDKRQFGDKVRVLVEADNRKSNGLGIPLPEGKVRVYKADTDGSLQFIGEDWIEHTPQNEKIRLFLGNAFDVVGEHAILSQKKISSQSREEQFEIKLRNHKKEDVMVLVTDHVWGDWTIKQSSHPYQKKNATTIEFNVPVKAGAETIITYTLFSQN